MSIAVIVIMVTSSVVIIPLFGKIQNRILELMKLFFAIDRKIKQAIIDRIVDF